MSSCFERHENVHLLVSFTIQAEASVGLRMSTHGLDSSLTSKKVFFSVMYLLFLASHVLPDSRQAEANICWSSRRGHSELFKYLPILGCFFLVWCVKEFPLCVIYQSKTSYPRPNWLETAEQRKPFLQMGVIMNRPQFIQNSQMWGRGGVVLVWRFVLLWLGFGFFLHFFLYILKYFALPLSFFPRPSIFTNLKAFQENEKTYSAQFMDF